MNAMFGDVKARPARRRWPGWTHEPVVHFLVIGALLLAANQAWRWLQPPEAIIVDAARVEHLSQLYRLQTGRDPGPVERESLVRTYIEEEALSREARALGLDRDDAIVRRRLVQKMEFLEPDVTAIPDDAELRRFQTANSAQFTTPADISFDQLYFSADSAGPAAAQQAARAALDALAAGAPADKVASDALPVMVDTRHQSVDALTHSFGDSPLVQMLATTPVGRWTGPVASGFGWHIIRVAERQAGRIPAFEQNRAAILSAWQSQATERARQQRLDALLARYPVIRTDTGDGGR